jgi:glutamate/tyrosine decarboxylase-like PLP-dependent enzyme
MELRVTSCKIPKAFGIRAPLSRRNRGVLHFELSRPGAQIIAQYYNLIHLDFTGYQSIMQNCLANARLLSKSHEATGWYTCVSDIHRKKGVHSFAGMKETVFREEDETSADYNAGLPVVAFRFSDEFKKEFPHLKQQTISNFLRAKQYIIPNCKFQHWLTIFRRGEKLIAHSPRSSPTK